MKPLGDHLLIELSGVDSSTLNQKALLIQILKKAVDSSAIALVKIEGHQFFPKGVTIFAIIGESHISMHTYPEVNHLSMDIYTCRLGSEAPGIIVNYIENALQPKGKTTLKVQRGADVSIYQPGKIRNIDSRPISIEYHVNEWVYSGFTTLQKIDIVENKAFGLMLFLDQELQIAEYDADRYNERLLGPLKLIDHPLNNICILGGGDGSVLSKLLSYNPGSITLVEIDSAVLELSQTYLSKLHHGAFEDDRVDIINQDGMDFLTQTDEYYDGIVYDLTTHPNIINQISRSHYMKKAVKAITDRLNKGGLAVFQCCSVNDMDTINLINKFIPQFFDEYEFHTHFIPSFCGEWLFAWGRNH